MSDTFKRNIVIGFGFSLLLLLISSVASFISIRILVKSSTAVEHTYQVMSELENINKLLYQAETSQRGYLVTADPAYLEYYDENIRQLDSRLNSIKKATSDNPPQVENVERLRNIINLRLGALNAGIDKKNKNQPLTNAFMQQGKQYMDNAQNLVGEMEDLEKALLAKRNENVDRFSTYTPLLIVLAALISLLITVVFYLRIVADYNERHLLYEEIKRKDEDLNKRIEITQGIAEKISAGDYKVRVDDEGRDMLGSLAGALNKMGSSLEYSFGLLYDKEWLGAGMADLNGLLLGEQDIETLTGRILKFISEYTHSNIGSFYLKNDADDLSLHSGYALSGDAPTFIRSGQGIVGQCAKDRKMIRLSDIAQEDFMITLTSGNIRPAHVVAFPVTFEQSVMGVIELGSLTPYTDNELLFLESISERAGIALNTSKERRRLQELLEETQSQAEELRMQHIELENINEELKIQSQKLQVSEEELKVQQEELMQTNGELEERSIMLEEKNQTIEERNREIEQTAEELAKTTKFKSEFLANMSHELRTPLNSILLLSRLITESTPQNLNEEQIEYARVIQSSGQGLLSLIDEILDLSRIESGKMDMDFNPVMVKEITNDLRSLFAPLAREKNIDFSITIDGKVPAQVETDKMRLEQILKNLLSNALKFTARGYVRLDILPAQNDPSAIVFSVKDTGIGISPDKQNIIFNAFQQADGSTRRQYGGTGLGLSISQELSRLLGGSIELDSEPGKGSEFRLVVPVKKPEHIDESSLSGLMNSLREKTNGGQVQAPAEPEMPEDQRSVLMTQDDTPDKMGKVISRIENILKKEPRKVLIVEENAKHAEALAYFLEDFNIEAIIRNDVESSIDTLLQKEGKCIILDLESSGGSIQEHLEKVKGTPGLEMLPVIVFTGKSLSKTEEARMKQYANSIVLKTAHSYQRILDEVSLFLHLADDRKKFIASSIRKLGSLTEVLKSKKVLIADDDVRNIFSLSKALDPYGINVLSAMDGKEALQQLQQNPEIDIVLMDMMMPEMDGYETMSRIRSMPGFKKMPIIAVTAKAMASDREKCISAGASDYITKPIDKDQLLSLLRVWLYDGK